MLKSKLRPRLAHVQFMLSLSSRDDPPSPSLLQPLCRLHLGATPSGPPFVGAAFPPSSSLSLRSSSVSHRRDSAAADGAEAIEVGVVEGEEEGVATAAGGLDGIGVWRCLMNGGKWEYKKDEGWKMGIWQNSIRHVALPNRIFNDK
ncbi:hypothetical protein SASPL_126721 [Salvia splendens]|uniref:Uncharacterized protein n=1 Tax=Salvia splendens TaxID=180675 RepID=A0A8X8XL02_SALSN|nr:hypothetical protein SASPL_126721 [Salvia splendens]